MPQDIFINWTAAAAAVEEMQPKNVVLCAERKRGTRSDINLLVQGAAAAAGGTCESNCLPPIPQSAVRDGSKIN